MDAKVELTVEYKGKVLKQTARISALPSDEHMLREIQLQMTRCYSGVLHELEVCN